MRKLGLIFLLLAVLVVACGGGGDDEKKEEGAPAQVSGPADAAKGEALFKQALVGSQPGCVTCHSLTLDQVLVGPSVAGVATRAASRVSGQSAEAYLRESIVDPDAYTVDGFAAGVMPAALADELSGAQTADLVAYLLTLK